MSHCKTALFADNVRQQHLLVMRHGLRQDEVDPNFTRRSSRPWDPPLSTRGRNQVRVRCQISLNEESVIGCIGGFGLGAV